MVETKSYNDIYTTTVRDDESGLITCKSLYIQGNDEKAKDRLMLMCLKHDLRFRSFKTNHGYNHFICSMKIFSDVKDFVEYIKGRMTKTKYSFKIKGKFALVKTGDKKYIYRIINNGGKS